MFQRYIRKFTKNREDGFKVGTSSSDLVDHEIEFLLASPLKVLPKMVPSLNPDKKERPPIGSRTTKGEFGMKSY